MCISSHLFHSSSAEQPKPIFPGGVNRSFHCNYKSLWKLLVVMTAQFIIVRAGWESCLDPKPALPGLEEDKCQLIQPCLPLSHRVMKKIICVLFEKCTFSEIGFWDVVWWQSPHPGSHHLPTAFPIPVWHWALSFMCCSLKRRMKEHSEVFEIANPLHLRFWVRHKLLWEWFSFISIFIQVHLGLEFWTEIPFLSEEERVGTWEYMDGHIHPLYAPAGFGAKPGLTTGRIFFPSGRSSDSPWPCGRCPTEGKSLPSSCDPPCCTCNPCCTGALESQHSRLPMLFSLLQFLVELVSVGQVTVGAFITYSLFMSNLKKAHFVRVGRIKIPNSMAAWLAPPLKCGELFCLSIVIWTGSAQQSGFWSESDLVQTEKAVCVIKCYWGFFELFFELTRCIAVGLLQCHGCKTMGVEGIITKLLWQ